MSDLHIISWNVTRRCNLECTHCYLPAITKREGAAFSFVPELSSSEALQLVDQIALVNSEVMLILSGGEPLLRGDIFTIAAHASGKGMMVVLGSNGLLIDDAVVGKLKKNGVTGISISLDSIDPEIHDTIRSCKGAWEQAVSAIRLCGKAGLSVQINTVVSRKNCEQLPGLIAYARGLGASVYSPFFLVCTGRGEDLTDLSPQQYEKVLSGIVESQGNEDGMKIRTRCAPTIRRLLHGKDPMSPLLKLGTGRCLAGRSYCRIAPEGDVTPCPYMPVSAGNIREQPFGAIWNNAEVFQSLRDPSLKGKCGACSYRLLCGGCRARAYAAHKDYLEEDPWCEHTPQGSDVIKPTTFAMDGNMASPMKMKPLWTKEAEERIKRVPSFVRAMVRGAVERYAIEHDYREITPHIMEELKQKAGMGGMHGHK